MLWPGSCKELLPPEDCSSSTAGFHTASLAFHLLCHLGLVPSLFLQCGRGSWGATGSGLSSVWWGFSGCLRELRVMFLLLDMAGGPLVVEIHCHWRLFQF